MLADVRRMQQLGVRFLVFNARLPAGAIERIVAACSTLPGCTLLECWRGGALLADDYSDSRRKALVELSETEGGACVAAAVRGECEVVELWRVLSLLIRVIERVLDDYPGMQYDEMLTCPACLAEGRYGDDAEEWDLYEDLTPDQTRVYCKTCDVTSVFRPAGAIIAPPRRATAPTAAPSAAPSAAPAASEGCRFFFVSAAWLRSYTGRTVPHFQTLQREHAGVLSARVVTLDEARTRALVGNVCTVSHRWMAQHNPDEDGTQLRALQAHLESQRQIEWVWYDAWCLPQGDRTEEEAADFGRMLREVNLLYLGSSVLILLDLSYVSRFWVRATERLNPPLTISPPTPNRSRVCLCGVWRRRRSSRPGSRCRR